MGWLAGFWETNKDIILALFGGSGVALFIWLKKIFSTSKKDENNKNTISVSGSNADDISQDNSTHIHHGPTPEQISAIAEAATKSLEKENQNLKEEKEQLELAIKALTEKDAEKYNIEEALTELEKGRTEAAKEIFRKITKEKEKNSIAEAAESYRHLGAIAFLDNTHEAIAAYERSLQLDPNNLAAWNQLGLLQKRVGNLNEAIHSYQKVLDLAGDNQIHQAVAYGNLGIVYRTQGEWEKAVEYYQKSLDIEEALGRKEGMAINYGNLGNVYLTQGELEKAEEFYNKAIALFEVVGAKPQIEQVKELLDSLEKEQTE